MPKEISHWVLAGRTIDLVNDGPVKDAIAKYPDHFDLGAVIYDCPFYAIAVKNSDEFAPVANRLHGVNGEDTFDPYRAFIDSYGGKLPPEASSFIAGALTHYGGDVTFHPFVNHFSGKYADSDPRQRHIAQARHRGIEGHMDIFLNGMYAQDQKLPGRRRLGAGIYNGGRFENTLRPLSESAETTEDIIRRFYWPAKKSRDIPLWPLLLRHGQIQRRFFNRALGGSISVLAKALGGGIDVIRATFYPIGIRNRGLMDPEGVLPFFTSAIEYRHPNTGEYIKGSVEDFAAKATTTAADLINEYQKLLKTGKPSLFLRNRKGLSLEYGCDSTKYPVPVHYNQNLPVEELCRTPFLCET